MIISVDMPTIMTAGGKSVTEFNSYRAYFFSSNEHIRYVRGVEAPDHMSARAAAELLLRQSEYAAVEIYEGWQLISRLDREQLAA
jgi:hypothetical protein